MMPRSLSLLLACGSILSGGCGTIGTFGSHGSNSAYHQSAWVPSSGPILDCECGKYGNLPPSTTVCHGDKTIPRVYSGVAWDMSLMSRADKYSALALLDLPFSIVGDTLLLGVTLIQQAAAGNICDGNSGKNASAKACADDAKSTPQPGDRQACAPKP
jgi:uncharacterized protein YceK